MVGVEDRATIKAVVSRQAQDGLTIAAPFLEQPGETQEKLNQELANCKTINFAHCFHLQISRYIFPRIL